MLLPPVLARHATPERWALLHEFRRFATVGFAGLAVDTLVVYGTKGLAGLYVAKLLGFLPAVTTTWALNRAWTFAGRGSGSLARQWALFVAANLLGAAVNISTYFLLVATVPFCAAHPILAILAGVGTGMFVNFGLSRRVVFRGAP